MASETLFSWIHLSDIHVGHGDPRHGWNQELVLEALRRDIQSKFASKGIACVLVTGDVAFSGNGLAQDEYARASEWLNSVAKAARIGPERIFIVPGNHDVNRGADRERQVERLVEMLRSGGKDPIDTALRDADDRRLLAKRMAGYLEFASQFGPWFRENRTPAAEQRLFWMHRIKLSEFLSVRLIGLNTALLAKDVDERKLQLGNEQIATALKPPIEGDGELVVVLSHHPLDVEWLSDWKEANSWIRNQAHVHLSGHVHEAGSGELRSGSGVGFVHVVAGAVHGERTPKDVPASHGYNYAEIVHDGRGALELRVWPRIWSEANKYFRPDVDNMPSDGDFASHQLRVKLGVAAATSVGGAAPPSVSYVIPPRARVPSTSVPTPARSRGSQAKWSPWTFVGAAVACIAAVAFGLSFMDPSPNEVDRPKAGPMAAAPAPVAALPTPEELSGTWDVVCNLSDMGGCQGAQQTNVYVWKLSVHGSHAKVRAFGETSYPEMTGTYDSTNGKVSVEGSAVGAAGASATVRMQIRSAHEMIGKRTVSTTNRLGSPCSSEFTCKATKRTSE